MGFLSDKSVSVRRDLERSPLDDSQMLARASLLPEPLDFAGSLHTGGIGVIAEVKRASPSAGAIAENADPTAQAVSYQKAGAAAISVLTDAEHFGGSLLDLQAVHSATSIPVLRKDFLVHPSQVIESRASGADAVLLITALLSASELDEMQSVAKDLGLGALVEVHSDEDLSKAIDAGAQVIGVNARDLESLDVDIEQAFAMLERVPADRLAVLESGVSSRAHVERAEAAGAAAVLVGESLMRSPDPGAKLEELLGKTAA
jgi:indole-3-glycerol phosphate synthase